MNANQLRGLLAWRKVVFEEKAVKNAVQFICGDGEVFMVYDTGTVVSQGKKTPLTETVEHESKGTGTPDDAPKGTDSTEPGDEVFIVYGHDQAARDNLELVLHRMGLRPIVLANLPAAGDTIIEKLEQYIGEYGKVGFACVLLTPDDQGYKAGNPHESKYRARQNVVLELGMVLARLGRRRVAILHKGSIELPSDIAGLIYLPFQERPEEVARDLFRNLELVGYKPKSEGL